MARRFRYAESRLQSQYVFRWTLFPAHALAENGFDAAARLLIDRRCDAVASEELAVAYDFLCDLYAETGREDAERAVAFLGRCRSIGIGLAWAEVATELHRTSAEFDLVNRRALQAWSRGDVRRAVEEMLDSRRRWEARMATLRESYAAV